MAAGWTTSSTARCRDDAAYIAELEDAVVAAAVVIFGGGNTGPEPVDVLTEGLHEMAERIVRTVPRLAQAWRPS
jgi:molybdopterin biosynthesis enzyme MoaB